MIYNYNDYIINEMLNDNFLINEKLSFNSIKEILKKVKDKDQLINKLIVKYNNTKNKISRKNILMVLISLYIGAFTLNNNKWSKSNIPDNIEKVSGEILNKENITENDLISLIKKEFNKIKFTDPQKLSLSEKGKEFIKDKEGLKLKAYDIGDGKITIGYGHTNSKYNMGDTITKEQADKLFDNDIKYFENSIKRMFRQWKDNGHNVKITQGMYDALVSMSYNMGITGLRNSKFIYYVMYSDFDKASELIPKTNVNDKFPGLKKRRKGEQELFNMDLET